MIFKLIVLWKRQNTWKWDCFTITLCNCKMVQPISAVAFKPDCWSFRSPTQVVGQRHEHRRPEVLDEVGHRKLLQRRKALRRGTRLPIGDGSGKETWQYNPLIVITLGHIKSVNFNRMITLTDYFYLVVFNKWDARNVITLSGWSY